MSAAGSEDKKRGYQSVEARQMENRSTEYKAGKSYDIRKDARMRRLGKELLDAAIADRIGQILEEEQTGRKYYQMQETVLDTLDPDIRRKFENFAGNVAIEQAEEQFLIYRQAFFDGLYLGHLVF